MTRLVGSIAFAVVLAGCGGDPAAKTPAIVAENPCHAATKQSPPHLPEAPTTPAAFENLSITAITVKGNIAVTSEKLTATSGLTIGAKYQRTAIAHAIVALYRSGEIDDVQVRAAPTDGGVALELLVRERPFVEGIFAPGATPEEATLLATRLGLAEGRRLDIAELHLRVLEKGAPNVDFELVPKRGNKVDVCLYRKTN